MLKTFMCDRHAAQKRAIKDIFGETTAVLHCCVHLARNIKNNCGQNSDIVSKFWEMRFKRTAEAEAAFVQTLEERHRSRPTSFTTELLNLLESFVPSVVHTILRKEVFPELGALHCCDLQRTVTNTDAKRRCFTIIEALRRVAPVETDNFSVDNTNAVDGFFN